MCMDGRVLVGHESFFLQKPGEGRKAGVQMGRIELPRGTDELYRLPNCIRWISRLVVTDKCIISMLCKLSSIRRYYLEIFIISLWYLSKIPCRLKNVHVLVDGTFTGCVLFCTRLLDQPLHSMLNLCLWGVSILSRHKRLLRYKQVRFISLTSFINL